MMIPKILLFLCLKASIATVIAHEKPSIDDCPNIGSEFKISPYLALAENLQKGGQVEATRKLRKWASSIEHDDQVFILCRMLFSARNEDEFRKPAMGGFHFLGGTGSQDWPLEPLTFHKNIPILITFGDSLGGQAEVSQTYVDYCVENCDWSQVRFKAANSKTIATVIDDWLSLQKWPKELSDKDRKYFTNQAGEHKER